MICFPLPGLEGACTTLCCIRQACTGVRSLCKDWQEPAPRMAESGRLALGSQVGGSGHPSTGAPQGLTLACSGLCCQQYTPQRENISVWSERGCVRRLFYAFHSEINGAIPNLFLRFASPEKPALIWKPMPRSSLRECCKNRQCGVFPGAASLVS